MKLIKDLGMQKHNKESKTEYRFGIYECPYCLKHFRASSASVKYRKNPKCAKCYHLFRRKKIRVNDTRLYKIWCNMKSRCNNKNILGYSNYGGRDISIDPAWNVFIIFKNWALSNGYSDNLTIDRINNDGNYEPSNCRWATKTVQARNIQKIRGNNTSGFIGVSWYKTTEKWKAYIGLNGKVKGLGYFKYPWTAALARDSYIMINNLNHTMNYKIKKDTF